MSNCLTHLHKSTEATWLPTYTPRSSVKVKLVPLADAARCRLHQTFQEVKSCTYCRKGEFKENKKMQDATSTLPLFSATRQAYKRKKIYIYILNRSCNFCCGARWKGAGACSQERGPLLRLAVAPARSSLRCLVPRKSTRRAFWRRGKHPETPIPIRIKHEVWSSLWAGKQACSGRHVLSCYVTSLITSSTVSFQVPKVA